MRASLPILVLTIFMAMAMSGCLSSEQAACERIAFPGPGARAHRIVEYANPGEDLPPFFFDNITATMITKTLVGDGTTHEALVMVPENGFNVEYLSLDTGDRVRRDLNYVQGQSLRLNEGAPFNLFFGRCLVEGHTWSAHHEVPRGGIEISVLEASDSRVRAQLVREPYQRAHFGNGTIEGRVMDFVWEQSRLFPNIIQISRLGANGTEEPVSVTRLLSQEHRTMDVSPKQTLTALDEAQAVARWPPFALPDQGLPLGEFISEVEGRPAVADYLVAHPSAYASFVRYEVVDEQESTAYVWSALLRDDTNEAVRVEWVKRCFEDEVMKALYGECQYSDEYAGPGSFNNQDDPYTWVAQMALPDGLSSVAASDIVVLARLFGEGQAMPRIDWRAHPWEEPLMERGAAVGPPGWVAWFGEITGEMVLTSEGPRGNLSGYEASLTKVDLDAMGWALSR